MNDHKAVATILFRTFGVIEIVYALLYWPYNLLVCHYTTSAGFIVATLYALVYIVLGLLLFIFSSVWPPW